MNKMLKPLKTLCVYHSRDLDGWMSAAIVKKKAVEEDLSIGKSEKFAGEYTTFFGWDYGDKIPDLSEYEKVIMVDISFPAKIMKELHGKLTAIKGYLGEGKEKQPGNFIWIDHHISAIKDMENEYPVYAHYIGKSIPISMPFGLRDPKFAACELTWKYFFPDEPMPELVRLLGRYDCFGHKGTDEEKKVLIFQYAARASLSNYEECYKTLLSVNDSHIEGWLNNGQAIYNYLCTEAKQTYAKAFPIVFSGISIGRGKSRLDITYRFLCVNQERFNPINFGIDYHKDGYEGFACFWYKDDKWNFSLYSEKVDCSVIAKGYGGGGHKGAAGFTTEEVDLFIK